MEGFRGGRFLSEDILKFCVLPRLPVKSLIRFKCVSKSWCSIISNDQFFILQQYQNCKSLPSLNFYVGWRRCMKTSWTHQSISSDQSSLGFRDLIPHVRRYKIIASCNGLVAIECPLWQTKLHVSPGMPSQTWVRELFVGNPVHQDWRWIPGHVYPSEGLTVGLAFDPVRSTSRYELVYPYFIQRPISKEIGFKVFSSEKGVWEVSKSKIMLHFVYSDANPVFLSGTLYWGTERGAGPLLWYNIKKDLPGLIPLPLVEVENHGGCLFESNGNMNYTRIIDLEIEVWSMKDSRWSKIHHIGIQDMVERKPKLFAPSGHNIVLWHGEGTHIFCGAHIFCGISKQKIGCIFPILFQGKVVFFQLENKTFGIDVETGEPTLYSTNFAPIFVPPPCFLYKPCLFSTPGLQLFPQNWEPLQPELEGYICFKTLNCSLNINIRKAGDTQL